MNALRPSASSALDLFESRIVWLLGTPRSGSTWLMNLLARHSSIRQINEPLIGMHLAVRTRVLLGDVVEEVRGAPLRVVDVLKENDGYFFTERYRDHWEPKLRELVLARLAAQFDDMGGDVATDFLVVKEPNGSDAIDLLRRLTPRSRVLLLVRDGRDVVDSMLDGIQPEGWASSLGPLDGSLEARREFIDAFAHLWVQRINLAMGAANRAEPDAFHLLRYRDLRANTLDELTEIYRWMGLDPPPDIDTHVAELDFDRIPADKRGPRRFHRAATPGLWREHLTDDEQRHLNEVMGPTLSALGYT